jgi:site-specific DNA recombinase
MIKAALLCRNSSEEQAERGTIENQLIFLREYCKLYDIPIHDEYLDEGIPGTVKLSDRPGGSRLLEDAKRGAFNVVLVYRLDRLGRSLLTIIDAFETLKTYGVDIRSATEPFDTSTPFGKFLFQFLASLAEFERALIHERTSAGRHRVARRGKWTTGKPPFGYALDVDGHLTPSTKLVPQLNITEADLIKELFERVASKESTAQNEARRFNALGIPSIRGGVWYAPAVSYIIHNTLYKGTRTFEANGETVTQKAPALVTPEVWKLANEQLKANKNLPSGNQVRDYLLRGLITCDFCKGKYVGCLNRNGRKGSTWSKFYYRCGNQLRSHGVAKCRSKVISADRIEAEVWKICQAIVDNPGDTLEKVKTHFVELQKRQHEQLDRQPLLEKALAEKAKERERLMKLYMQDKISCDEVEKALDELGIEVAVLRKELDSIRTVTELAFACEQQYTRIATLLATFKNQILEDSKREVIETLIQGVTITTKTLKGKKTAVARIDCHFSGNALAVRGLSDPRKVVASDSSSILSVTPIKGGSWSRPWSDTR